MDHYWDNMTGGIGKFVANTTNLMHTMYAGEKPDVSKVPFLRRVRGEVNDYWTISRFREIQNHLTQLKRDEKLIRESGTDQEKEKLNLHMRAQSASTQLKQLRDAQDNIKSKDGDPEKIEKLDKLMMDVRNNFLKVYRDRVEKKPVK